MAISWGSYQSTGTQSARVGIELTRSSTASTSTITAKFYVQFTQAVNDDMRLSYSGALGGHTDFRHRGGTVHVATRTITRSRQYGSSQTVTVGASLSGVYNGLTPSHTHSISVPARAYEVPYAPKSVTATRQNDGRINVSWVRNSSTARPWQEVQVQQWDNVEGWNEQWRVSGSTTTLGNTGGVTANKRYRYRVRARNSAGWGAWAYSNYVYTSPAAPTNAKVTRNSDTQHTVSWTANYTGSSDKSWQDVRVYRWDNVGGEYKHIVTLTNVTTTSYADKTTRADRRYRYRVRSRNDTAYSSYAYTGYISTTPAAPRDVSAVKSGDDIIVEWTNVATHADGIEVWHAANGVWDSTALAVLSGQPTSYRHVNPDPTVTHTYRLKSRETADTGPNLYSAYSSQSNTIQLLTNPSPPSALGPAGVIDADEGVTLRWTHNSVDTTEQIAYEIQYRQQGHSSWTTTGKTSSSDSVADFSSHFSNGSTWEWRVRTWGQYADPSAWSATAVLRASARPHASVVSPGDVVTTSSLTVEWSYFDEEGTDQAEWRATLYDAAGNVLERREAVGTASSHTFSRRVRNKTTYVVGVSVRDGDGLWSHEDVFEFEVDYALPSTPIGSAEWHIEEGSVVVSVTNPEPDLDEVPTVYNEVWRSPDPEAARLLEEYHEAVEDRDARGLSTGPATNIVPNPRGRMTDGTVVVRENLSLDPRPRSAWGGTTDPDMTFMGKPSQRATSTTMIVGENVAARRTPVVAGKTYTITVWMRSPEAFTGQIRYYLYGGGTFSDLGPEVSVPANEWTPVSATFTVAEGQTATLPMVYGAPSGQTWWVGAALVEEGEASRSYFDGDTWDDPDLTPEWTGEPGLSTSRLLGPQPVGWTPLIGSVAYYSESRDAVAVLPDPFYNAAYVSAEIDGDPPGPYTRVFTLWTDTGNPVVTTVGSDEVFVGDGETLGVTVPTSPLSFLALFSVDEAHPVNTIFIRAQVTPGEYPGPYFDGDSQAEHTEYSWTGEPHESTSVAEDVAVDKAWARFDNAFTRTAALVVSGVEPDTAVTDHIPTPGARNTYRVVAYSGLPSTAESEPFIVETNPVRGWAWLNAGPDFSEMVRIRDNLEVSLSFGREKALHRFAGRPFPVEMASEARNRRISVSARLGPDSSSFEEIEALADFPAPICYRDAAGRRFFVSVSDVSGTHRKITRDVSLTLTEVDFLE